MMDQLPGLRALVADPGITFTNFFVNDALCCPSRASILRGQYPHNHHVTSNTRPSGGYLRVHEQDLEESTIATWLNEAGYTTGLVGKYLNEHPTKEDRLHIPPGWDEWYSEIDGDITRGFNFALNEHGAVAIYRSNEADYYTDVVARRSEEVLRRMAARQAPFFLVLSLCGAVRTTRSGSPGAS
jgi:arylsulfatase A-like enzyme